VGERIRRYYKRKVDAVVYPPIADIFSKKVDAVSVSGQKKRDMYYLAVGRLVGYKRMDIVIAACNTLKLPLVVIGSGHEEASLRKLAGPTIQLVTRHLTDEELVGYYEGCHALLYGGDEDFGLVAAEALACHVPVVAYKKSGVSEIIDEGKTGIFFEEKTSASLEAAIKSLDKLHYDHDQCVRRAHEFSIDIFQKQIKKIVEDLNKRRIR
jgi:glycosyltransferase involved in cell wall biosynthesis